MTQRKICSTDGCNRKLGHNNQIGICLRHSRTEATINWMRTSPKRIAYLAKPEHKVARRERHLRENYGITTAQYEAMVEIQGNACAICKEPNKNKLRVDHCHRKKIVRALLCNHCNIVLGHLKESIPFINSIKEYLLSYEI